MLAIAPCRTEAMGGHVSQCSACQERQYRDHACKPRHGPTGQNHDATRGRKTQRELRVQTAAAAWPALALDAKDLGGHLGMLGVRPTWTRALASPPQGHSLVPAAALSPTGSRCLAPRSTDWLVPVPALSTRFRGKCKHKRTHAHLLAHLPASLWHWPWVTHCKPAGTGHEVIASLAPSRRRLAITSNRLAQLTDGHVTFRFQESQSHPWQRRTLPAQAFSRRFLQQVLPKGFITVRYSGFLSPTCRPTRSCMRHLLAAATCQVPAPNDAKPPPPHDPHAAPRPTPPCPRCGGQLVLLQHLAVPTRAPPCSCAPS